MTDRRSHLLNANKAKIDHVFEISDPKLKTQPQDNPFGISRLGNHLTSAVLSVSIIFICNHGKRRSTRTRAWETRDLEERKSSPTISKMSTPGATMQTGAGINPVQIIRGVEYRCGDCGAKNIIKGGDPVRCRQCGFRILYKTRTKRCECFN